MALQTPVVTLTGIKEPQAKLYKVSFLMTVADDSTNPLLVGLNVPHTIDYNQGTNIADKVDRVVKFFQDRIDRYNNEAGIVEAPALATALASINSGLVV